MGYYSVGVRRGELSDGDLTLESITQIEETAMRLKESKIAKILPDSISSDGSPEGIATATLLAELLGIERVLVNDNLLHPPAQLKAVRAWVVFTKMVPVGEEDWLSFMRRNIAEGDPLRVLVPGNPRASVTVCQNELLEAYLIAFYEKYGKLHLAVEENLLLKPGEAFISEQHYEWEAQVRQIFLSKGREDVLAVIAD